MIRSRMITKSKTYLQQFQTVLVRLKDQGHDSAIMGWVRVTCLVGDKNVLLHLTCLWQIG